MFGLKHVFMGVKYWLLFPGLPANHCVEHGHLIVINISKCWDDKIEPHRPLEIFIMGSARPRRVASLQLLIQLGTEKLWRKFQTMSPSFARITQWNYLLPDAHAERKRTAATVVGINFQIAQSQLSVQLFLGDYLYSADCSTVWMTDKQVEVLFMREVFLTFILLAVGIHAASSIWDFSVAVKKGLEHRLWDHSERFGLFFPSSSSWKRYGACG